MRLLVGKPRFFQNRDERGRTKSESRRSGILDSGHPTSWRCPLSSPGIRHQLQKVRQARIVSFSRRACTPRKWSDIPNRTRRASTPAKHCQPDRYGAAFRDCGIASTVGRGRRGQRRRGCLCAPFHRIKPSDRGPRCTGLRESLCAARRPGPSTSPAPVRWHRGRPYCPSIGPDRRSTARHNPGPG